MYITFRKFFNHLWTANWSASTDEASRHEAYIKLTHCVRFLGKHTVPGTQINVNVTQQGLGVVLLKFALPLGYLWVIETVTPIHPLLCKYHHTCWGEWKIPRFVGKMVLNGLVAQAER